MSEQVRPFKETLIKVERLQSSPDNPDAENPTPQWSKTSGETCSDETLVIRQSASATCSLDGGLYSGNVWNDTIRAFFSDKNDALSITQAFFIKRGTGGDVKKPALITHLLDQWDGYHKVHIRFPPEVNEGEWDLRVEQTNNYPMYIGSFTNPPEPPPFQEDRPRYTFGRSGTAQGGFEAATPEYFRVHRQDLDFRDYQPPEVGENLWIQEEETNITFKYTVSRVREYTNYFNFDVEETTKFVPPHITSIRLGEPLNPAAPSDRPLVFAEHDSEQPGSSKNGQMETFKVSLYNPTGIKGGLVEASLDGVNTLVSAPVEETDEPLVEVFLQSVLKDDMPKGSAESLRVNFVYKRNDGLEYEGNTVDVWITNTGEGSFHYDTKKSYSSKGGLAPYGEYLRIADYDLSGSQFGPFEVGDSIKWRKLNTEDWIEKEITEKTKYTGYRKYSWEGSVSWPNGFYEFREVGEEPDPDPDPDDVEINVEIVGPQKVVYGNSIKFTAIVSAVNEIPKGKAELATTNSIIDEAEFAGVVDDKASEIIQRFDFFVNVPEKSNTRAGDTVMVHAAYKLPTGEEFLSDELQVQIVESNQEGGIGMLTYVEYIKLITNAPEWPAVEDSEIESLLLMNQIKDQAGNSPGDPDWVESYWVARVCQEVYELKLSRATNAVDTSTSSGSFSQSQVSANLSRQARRWRSRTGAGDNGRLLGLGDNWALLGRG